MNFLADFDVVLMKMILNEYASEDRNDREEDEHACSDDSDAVPQLFTSREDFSLMVDDFLDNYEILGGRMKPKLAGESGMEKLETLRTAMGQDERIRVRDEDTDEDILMPLEAVDTKDRWDCETILSEDTSNVPLCNLIPYSYLLQP